MAPNPHHLLHHRRHVVVAVVGGCRHLVGERGPVLEGLLEDGACDGLQRADVKQYNCSIPFTLLY